MAGEIQNLIQFTKSRFEVCISVTVILLYSYNFNNSQKVYTNSPLAIYANATDDETSLQALNSGLILGGEAAMWTEQADGASIISKIFPRASALAERLWSNPTTGWYEAETRMVYNRQRYVERGLDADALQPEWCLQNEGHCFL